MSTPLTIEYSSNFDAFAEELESETLFYVGYDVLVITDVPYIAKGFEVLSQEWFKSEILKLSTLYGICLKVSENVYEKLSLKPQILDVNGKDSFFLTFQSIRGKRESKTFWKIASHKNIFSLFIDDDETEDVTSFFHEFLANELKNSRPGN